MGNVLAKALTADLAIQLLMFSLAWYQKSERFYDLTGSSTFILLVMQSLMGTGKFFPRQVCFASMCVK